MAGAAKPRKRIGKRIQDESFKSKELYSLHRRSDTPTQIQPSFSASSSAGTNNGDVNFLPTGGGTMIGALAFFPKLLTISSGAIDISKNTIDYTSRVIVSPESGSTDDLTTITGAAHAGQLLFLQGVETDTITITNAGNIETIDGADFTLEDDDILIFMFDTTDNKWQQVTTGKQGVLAGGSFISASLSADQTTNIAATNHVEFDTTDSGTLVLQTGSGQADGIFELLSGKTYVLNASLRPEFSGATGSLVVAWYDITNTAELGKRAIYEPVTQTTDDANQPSCQYVFTPASDITVELRIISVTALTALANEYCHAVIFGAGAGSGGGGGAISFPITPTINDHGNVGTTTEDIDLSLSTGHVHKITLTGNPTLTFSNPPASGTQIEFEIEFIQDATGNRTVTWPASVVETISISKTASTTTIITCRTNDGGTTYHAIPALRGSITLSSPSFANITLSNLDTTSINDGLLPDADATQNLGGSSLAWAEIWVDAIRNDGATTVSSPTFTIASTTINLGDAGTDQVNILAAKVLPALDATTQLGETALAWAEIWVDTLQNDAAIAVAAPTFSINSTTINLGDAGGDTINILGNEVLPALDATTQLGKTALAWKEIWVDTLTNDATLAIAAPTFSINSATINIGDASGDAVNLLAATYTPALDETVIFGATTKELKEVWVSTLRNSASISIAPVSSTSITSPTINLGDATSDDINVLGQIATNIVIEEISIPAASPANTGRFYAKDSGGVSVPYWQDEAGTESTMIGSGGADTDLNNLTTTSINTDLLPDSDNGQDLGGSGLEWANLWVTTLQNNATIAISSPTLSITSATINLGDAASDVINVLGVINSDVISTGGTNDIGNSTTGQFNSLYLDNTLFCSNLKVWTGDSDINVFNDLDMQAGDTVDFADTSTTATTSIRTLPAQPDGFIVIKVNGASKKVPYYI